MASTLEKDCHMGIAHTPASQMQGAPPQNMMCRAGASGSICRNPSRICSTRFGEPDTPVQCTSRPILDAAKRNVRCVEAVLPELAAKEGASPEDHGDQELPRARYAADQPDRSASSQGRDDLNRTKRYSPSLNRTRGGSRKARQVARWNSVFRSALS